MAKTQVSKKLNDKQKEILARKLGYDGPMNMFDQFIKSDQALSAKYNTVLDKYMAKGGAVKKFSDGGLVTHFTNLADAAQAKANDMSKSSVYREAMQLNANLYKDLAKQHASEAGQAAPTFNVEKVETGPQLSGATQTIVNQYQGIVEDALARGDIDQARNYQGKIERRYAEAGMQAPENVTQMSSQLAAIGPVLDIGSKNIVAQYQGIVEDALAKGNLAQAKDFQEKIERIYSQSSVPVPDNVVEQSQNIQETIRTEQPEAALGVGISNSVKQYQLLVEDFKQKGQLGLANQYQQEIEREYARAGLLSPTARAAAEAASSYEAPSGYAPSSSEKDLPVKEARILAADAIRENNNAKASEISNALSRNEISQAQYASLMSDLEKQTAQDYATLNKTAETNNPTNVLAFVDNIRAQINTSAELPSASETPTTPVVPPTTTTPPTTGTGTKLPTTATGSTTPENNTLDAPYTTPTTGTGTTTPTTTPTTAPTATAPTSLSAANVQIPQVTAATVPTTTEQMASAMGAPSTAAQITPTTAGQTAVAPMQAPKEAATTTAATAAPQVQQALQTVQPATGTVSEQALMQPETMAPTETAVSQLQAPTAEATLVQPTAPRTVQAGELVSGPAVDMGRVEETLSQAQAAQGEVTPEMTVQYQIQKLTADFDATNPPPWAAGAIRNVNAVLAQRGMGASSLAGQAVVQAALESALPIAAADAATYKEMGIQNLANRQQIAVLTAQQRAAFLGQEFDQAFQTRVINAATISEIANINFTAEQQIALENARLTNTVNLANLSNQQALIMAEAAQIANLETANLNNRQQAAVLNAQAFLQMDMTNLANEQQTELFKAQSMVNSILTDSAAENAARQFNASSINQVNQFYDGLTAQINQFNAAQTNGMEQFNVSQINAVAEFNASVQNARDQFNAEFRRIIDQSNVEWRRNIALADTAAINRANEINATNAMGITSIEYNNLWQQYRDQLEMAWKTSESALDRETQLAMQVLAKQAQIEAAKYALEAEKAKALGGLTATVLDKSGIISEGGKALMATIKNMGGSTSVTGPSLVDYLNSNPGTWGLVESVGGVDTYFDGTNELMIDNFENKYYLDGVLIWEENMPFYGGETYPDGTYSGVE